MATMDWDRRFSSIVAETEKNLAKVKEKLLSASRPHYTERWRSEKYLPSINKKNLSVMDDRVSSPNPEWRNGCGGYYTDLPPAEMLDAPTTFGFHDKMKEQKKTIDQLTKILLDMEIEKDTYQRQIDDLQRALSEISDRQHQRQFTSHMAHDLERIKRDVTQEVQSMRDDVRKLYHDSCRDMVSTRYPPAVFPDMRNGLNDVFEEMTCLKKDIDLLRSRLSNVEFVSTHRRDDEDRSILDEKFSKSWIRQSRPHSSIMCPPALLLPLDPNLDRLQLDHLKSTVSAMKTKLNQMEMQLNANHPKPNVSLSRRANRISLEPKVLSDDSDSLSDILDDSDTDTLFSGSFGKFDQGDLELEDLDLSCSSLSEVDAEDDKDDIDIDGGDEISISSADLADIDDI